MIRAIHCLPLIMVAACGSAPNRTSTAAEQREAAAAKPDVAARPARPGDLDVSVRAPQHIGALREEHVDEYPLVVVLHNGTGEPLELAPATAEVRVLQGAELVEGCSGEVPLEALPEVLPASELATARVQLPCALPDEGEYEVAVSIAPLATDARAPVSVHRTMADFGTDAMPIAPIHAPFPSGLVAPAPYDVRPTPPSGGSR